MTRLLALIGVIGLSWVGGLFWFIDALPRYPAADIAAADGVVVFTGDGERVPAAMALIEGGAGRRLLISGVNPRTSRDELASFWPGQRARFDCCVDLGREATTTNGNAAEVRAWVALHGYDDIVLVTSDYHMPRAMLEMGAALPGAAIMRHPVSSDYLGPDGRPTSWRAWRVIALEYTKYLAIRARMLFA